MSVAPAVALSIQVVNGTGRDGGNDGARGRARGGGARRGKGRGRGHVVQPFKVASALCVTGGKLHNQNMPLSTHTVGHGDVEDTYVRIDLTQKWLQWAVAGKQITKLPIFCPVLNEIRACYIAAVEGSENDNEAGADKALVDEKEDPMNQMMLSCMAERVVEDPASKGTKDTIRKRKWNTKSSRANQRIELQVHAETPLRKHQRTDTGMRTIHVFSKSRCDKRVIWLDKSDVPWLVGVMQDEYTLRGVAVVEEPAPASLTAPAMAAPNEAANSAASDGPHKGFTITWNFSHACWQAVFDHVTVCGKTLYCRLEDMTPQKAEQIGKAFHAEMTRDELKAMTQQYLHHKAEQIVQRTAMI